MALPPSLQRQADQAAALEQTLGQMTDRLTEQHWRIVAALVREATADAAGLVLHGGDTENGMRLSLTEVVGPGGTPLTVAPNRLQQLEDELEYSLLWIAEHEDEQTLRGDHTHELPAMAPSTTVAAAATVPAEGGPAASTEATRAEARLRAAYETAMHQTAGMNSDLRAAVHDHVDELLYVTCPNQRVFQRDDNGYIAGDVRVDLDAFVDHLLEGVIDLLSEALTGSALLMDVNWRVVGHDGDTLRLLVSGDPSEVVAQADPEEHRPRPHPERGAA